MTGLKDVAFRGLQTVNMWTQRCLFWLSSFAKLTKCIDQLMLSIILPSFLTVTWVFHTYYNLRTRSGSSWTTFRLDWFLVLFCQKNGPVETRKLWWYCIFSFALSIIDKGIPLRFLSVKGTVQFLCCRVGKSWSNETEPVSSVHSRVNRTDDLPEVQFIRSWNFIFPFRK